MFIIIQALIFFVSQSQNHLIQAEATKTRIPDLEKPQQAAFRSLQLLNIEFVSEIPIITKPNDPTIVALSNGGFAIAFDATVQTSQNEEIWVVIYEASGVPAEHSPLLVKSTGNYFRPDIASGKGFFCVSFGDESTPANVGYGNYSNSGSVNYVLPNVTQSDYKFVSNTIAILPNNHILMMITNQARIYILEFDYTQTLLSSYSLINEPNGEVGGMVSLQTGQLLAITVENITSNSTPRDIFAYWTNDETYAHKNVVDQGPLLLIDQTQGVLIKPIALQNGGALAIWTTSYNSIYIYFALLPNSSTGTIIQSYVNTSSYRALNPKAAQLKNGKIVIVWAGLYKQCQADLTSIIFQFYDDNGEPTSSQIILSDACSYQVQQQLPGIVALLNGDFIISYIGCKNESIFAQRLNSEGVPKHFQLCSNNLECSTSQVCNQETGSCQQCVTSAQCSNPFPICNSSGSCQICLTTEDCQSAFDSTLNCEAGSCLPNSLPSALQAVITQTEGVSNGAVVLSLLNVAFDSGSGLLNFLRFMFYMLYFNVEYPQNLEEFLRAFSGCELPFVMPNIFDINGFIDLRPYSIQSPQKFNDNNFDGLFLLNSGSTLLSFLVLFIIGLCARWAIRFPSMNKLQKRLKTMASNSTWTGFLILWIELFMQLILAAVLQITLPTAGGIEILSYVIALPCIVFGIYVLFAIYNIQKSYYKQTLNPLALSSNKEDQAILKLSKDLKRNSFHTLMIPFVTLLRNFLHCWFLVIFYYIPLLQVGSCLLISFLYLLWLCHLRPWKQIKKNLKAGIQEAILCFIYFLIFVMENLERNGPMDVTTKNNMGYVIISLGLILLIMSVITEIRKWFKRMYKFFKKKNLISKGRRIKRANFRNTFVQSNKDLEENIHSQKNVNY